MLAAALPVARSLGIDPALLTRDEDNIASRKVIEANGGMLEDNRHGKLRYWVPVLLTAHCATPITSAGLRLRRTTWSPDDRGSCKEPHQIAAGL